jgi:hypothetical protein
MGDKPQAGRKRWPAWARWMAWGVGMALGAPLAALVAFMVLTRNLAVELPQELRATEALPALLTHEEPIPEASPRAPKPRFAEATRATSPTLQSPPDKQKARVFGSADAPDALRRRADELERQATDVLAKLDRLQADRKAFLKQQGDPDARSNELEKRKLKLIADFHRLRGEIGGALTLEDQRRWNALFLKSMTDQDDWYMAADFCLIDGDPRFDHWQTLVYCSQRMDFATGTARVGAYVATRLLRRPTLM